MPEPKKNGHGGARPNSGPRPDWLKKKCRDLIQKHKLIDFLVRVAAGQETEERLSKDGEVIPVQCGIGDRLKALEMLMERGFGKTPQGLQLGDEESPLVINFIPVNKDAKPSSGSAGH